MREIPPCANVRLGTLEAQVMDVLWQHGPSTVRDVIDHISSGPAYTTIATVLGNLSRKELVTVERENHSTRYSTALGRDEYAACGMARRMATFAEDRTATLSFFTEYLSDDDLDALQRALDKRRVQV